MVAIAPNRATKPVHNGIRGFLALVERLWLELPPFQRKIARAAFGAERELLVLLPRGNGKSRLFGLLAVHHLLTHREPQVFIAASSREQASVVFGYAAEAIQRLDVDAEVLQREIRTERGFLRVLGSDAARLHGIHPTRAIVDEMHTFRDGSVYEALRTGLLAGSKLIVISTAGQGTQSALGQLRARALAQPRVSRRGALTDARGPRLRMLEWAVPEERELTTRELLQANPAPWATAEWLKEQREAVPEHVFCRYHANQWVGRIGSWLPSGAWPACAATYEIEPGSRIWVGVDIGGARADTAIVWLDEQFRIGCRIWSGGGALMDATAFLPALAQRYRIAEIAYDPWRAQTLAKIAEQHGIKVTAFPQSDARMIPASAALHQTVVEGRVHHPDDPKLNEHVAAAVAKHGRRGWRIDQAERGANIDGLIALVMAHEARTAPEPAPTRVLGWL
jgi:phage terminase large subunit-like protein